MEGIGDDDQQRDREAREAQEENQSLKDWGAHDIWGNFLYFIHELLLDYQK